MDCFIKKEYWINRQVQIYKKTPDAEVIRPWIWRFLNKRTSNRYNLLINTDKKQANQMNFYQKYFTSCFNPRLQRLNAYKDGVLKGYMGDGQTLFEEL